MQPSWVLEDGTRIDLTVVASRAELSLFAHHDWSAHVNGTAVPTDTRRIRGASTENVFELPDGREAVASVLMLRGACVCELAIGDERILYPGKRPFVCPACSNPVEPHLSACILCKAEQPSRAARIREMQFQALAISLLHLNLVCIALGVTQIIAADSTSAFLSLRSAEAATTLPIVQAFQTASESASELRHVLGGTATYMSCVFGCALLALRAPATAGVLNLLTLAFMFANRLLTFEFSWLGLAIGAGLTFASVLIAERGIELAHASLPRT
jgi:hypothetical protein